MDLLENCDECYQFTLSELPATSIIIKGGLTPTTNYILKVTDKFGNKYSSTTQSTDGSGNLTVTLGASFPPQFFNRNAGTFRFEVSKTAMPWAPETVTFNSIGYTCVLVDFVNDDSAVNVIE
jgi:hypothetical protein